MSSVFGLMVSNQLEMDNLIKIIYMNHNEE